MRRDLSFYDRLFTPRVTVLPNGKQVEKRASRMPLILLAVCIVTGLSLHITGFNLQTLIKRGHQFFVILEQLFTPDFGFAKHVWKPLFATIQMSIMGSFIGCVLALPYSVLCSSNIISNRLVLTVCRVILSVLRTLPTLVLALIATLIFKLGTFAGTLAISIFNFSMVSKMMYEHIETIDMGPYEAMEALGAGKARAFFSAVLPQVLPIYLSNCLFCVETTVRHAAVLGYVGAGGIGLTLSERISLREYHHVGMLLLMLFITVLLLESISRALRKRLS